MYCSSVQVIYDNVTWCYANVPPRKLPLWGARMAWQENKVPANGEVQNPTWKHCQHKVRASKMEDRGQTYLQSRTTHGDKASWFSLLEAYGIAAVGPLTLVQCSVQLTNTERCKAVYMAVGCSAVGSSGVEISREHNIKCIQKHSVSQIWIDYVVPTKEIKNTRVKCFLPIKLLF